MGELDLLSDGTRIEDLFDLKRRRISARVFSDSEVFKLEMDRVFGHSWLFVGLESEIPNPRDYVTRPMGDDSVIVTRGDDGQINIVLNRCTHRGAQLCVTDCGSAERFRCPYHGWMFERDGTLFGMPQERNWLGENGRKEDFGLPTARVDTRGGLIFGTWDRELPDFESYLGDFRFYFDMVFNSVDKHLVTTGPPQRWRADFNWKLGTENFLGDVYHTPTAHLSAADLGMMPQIDRSVFGVGGSDPAGGHGFYALHPRSIGREPGPLGATLAWLPPEVIPQLDSHMDEAQMRLLREGVFPAVGSVFPNFSWIAMPTFFLLRLWSPAASGELEVYNWVVAHPDSSEKGRAMQDQGLNVTFGFTGMLEQDDMVTWVRIQRGTSGAQSRRQFSSYACTQPADPTGFFPDGSDWPGPGEIRYGFVTDDHIWNFHLRWRERMCGDL